jgi:hypothetical protein
MSDNYEFVDVDPAAGIVVDDELAVLIPPLSAEERKELEVNLVEHGGARDALIVWDRDGEPPVLLDGHNRLEVCRRLGLAFAVKGIRFASRDQASNWIERNQLGRRNLSRESFAIILGRIYNATKLKKGGQTKETKGRGKTRERLGRKYGLDDRTVEKAGKFQTAAVKLGVESEIASGRLRVPQYRLIDAAKTLPANPTREESDAAIRRAMGAPAKKCGRDPPKKKNWLVPADPADCLKAIHFYAKTFAFQAPGSIDALNDLLTRLIEESAAHAHEMSQ